MLRRKHTVDAVERAYQEALKAQRKAYEWCLELYKDELNRRDPQPVQTTIVPPPPIADLSYGEETFMPVMFGNGSVGDEYDEVAEDMAWLKSQGLVTDDEVAELMAAAGGNYANPEVSDE